MFLGGCGCVLRWCCGVFVVVFLWLCFCGGAFVARSVGEESCRQVLEKSVGGECCRRVLSKSVGEESRDVM